MAINLLILVSIDTVWNERNELLLKNFREMDSYFYYVFSNKIDSRNFCQKIVGVMLLDFQNCGLNMHVS